MLLTAFVGNRGQTVQLVVKEKSIFSVLELTELGRAVLDDRSSLPAYSLPPRLILTDLPAPQPLD